MDNHAPTSRRSALIVTTTFLVLIFLPCLFHLRYGLRASDLRRWGEWLGTKPPGEAVRAIDQDFDRRFLLRFVATALTEGVPVVRSRFSSADVQAGTDGFLFATEDTQVC